MDIFDILRIKTIFPFFWENELTDVVTILIYLYNKLRLQEQKYINHVHTFRNWNVSFESNILLYGDSEKIILSKINKNYDIFKDNLLDIIARNRRKYSITNKITFSRFRIINNNIQFTITIGPCRLNGGIFLISYY
jgi:hypothetical protein